MRHLSMYSAFICTSMSLAGDLVNLLSSSPKCNYLRYRSFLRYTEMFTYIHQNDV